MGEQSAPAGLPEVGEDIAGKYRVEGTIGHGGMGVVLSARNRMTGKRVAIKWLLPDQTSDMSRERLLREARIAASIEHPNVVDVYDVGEHKGGLFLVMEYLPGRSLADVLATEGRLDPDRLINWLMPALRGVQAAHDAGIVHRDLKLEHVILSEVNGQIIPKVVDFGVSKAMGPSTIPNSSLTRTGALVGTPHYMALEQVDGSNAIDARTDVYAFGVILYRALTGHFPFDGSSLGEVILKIGTREPTPLSVLRPDLPLELEMVVQRAMSRARDLRFESVAELAIALEPFARSVRFDETSDVLRVAGSTSRELLLQKGMNTPGLSGTPRDANLTPRDRAALQSAPTAELSSSDVAQGHGARPGLKKRHVAAGVAAIAFALGVAAFLLFTSQTPSPAEVRPEPQIHAATPGTENPAPAAAALPVGEMIVPAPTVEAIAPAPHAEAIVPAPQAEAIAPMPTAPLAPQNDTETLVNQHTEQPPATDPGILTTRKAAPPAVRRAAKDIRGTEPKLIPGDRTKGLSADDF